MVSWVIEGHEWGWVKNYFDMGYLEITFIPKGEMYSGGKEW
jgi:hypothetical protein